MQVVAPNNCHGAFDPLRPSMVLRLADSFALRDSYSITSSARTSTLAGTSRRDFEAKLEKFTVDLRCQTSAYPYCLGLLFWS
jgi:hypothetical protein